MAQNIAAYLYCCQSCRPYFAEQLTLASNKCLSFKLQIMDKILYPLTIAFQHALWGELLDVGTEDKVTGQNNQHKVVPTSATSCSSIINSVHKFAK